MFCWFKVTVPVSAGFDVAQLKLFLDGIALAEEKSPSDAR